MSLLFVAKRISHEEISTDFQLTCFDESLLYSKRCNLRLSIWWNLTLNVYSMQHSERAQYHGKYLHQISYNAPF